MLETMLFSTINSIITTRWVYGFYIIAICALLFWFVRFLLQKERNKIKLLEEKFQEELSAIKKKLKDAKEQIGELEEREANAKAHSREAKRESVDSESIRRIEAEESEKQVIELREEVIQSSAHTIELERNLSEAENQITELQAKLNDADIYAQDIESKLADVENARDTEAEEAGNYISKLQKKITKEKEDKLKMEEKVKEIQTILITEEEKAGKHVARLDASLTEAKRKLADLENVQKGEDSNVEPGEKEIEKNRIQFEDTSSIEAENRIAELKAKIVETEEKLEEVENARQTEADEAGTHLSKLQEEVSRTEARRVEIEKKLIKVESIQKISGKDMEEVQMQLQASSAIPNIPYLDIAAIQIRSDEMPKDYYGFFPQPDYLYTAFGDATAHGVGAGLKVMETNLAMLASEEPGLSGMIDTLSTFLQKANYQGEVDTALTLLKIFRGERYGVLQVQTAGGGYVPILVLRASTGRVEEIVADNLTFDEIPNFRYRSLEFRLNKFDTLFLVSDGLLNLKNGSGKTEGFDGLINRISKTAEMIKDDIGETSAEEILNAIVNFGGKLSEESVLSDDVTLVVMKAK